MKIEQPYESIKVPSTPKSPEDETSEEIKPGYKTTEFWLTLLTAVGGFIVPDLPWEAVASVVAYVLSRGLAKHDKKK